MPTTWIDPREARRALFRALASVLLGLTLACGGEPAEPGTPAPPEQAGRPELDAAPEPAEAAPPAGTPSPAEEASPREATPDEATVALTRASLDFLRARPAFSFAVESSYEAVQDDGVKLEFVRFQRYLVRRPDRLRIEREDATGARRTMLFDGSVITILDATQGLYAQASHAGDIDAAVDFVRDILSAPIPLAELLLNDPRPQVEWELEEASTIGTETIDGRRCEHVLLRNPDADVQLWIAQGEQPVPVRMVILYHEEEGRPVFRARFFDWHFQPEVPDDVFAFQAPEGAERIPFAVRPRTDRPPPPPEEPS
jgi:hypothetical protein